MPRIFYRGNLTVNGAVLLDENASNHLLRVLRLKPGAQLVLFNGLSDEEYKAELMAIQKRQAEVKIQSVQIAQRESPLKIYLGQGISRAERMDYTLQKSVELGVYQITPLFTERCGVELSGERLQKRVEHWQQVVISACEQSGRCYVPVIEAPKKIEQWLAELKVDLSLVADPKSTKYLNDFQDEVEKLALLCGPEGGLSEAELELVKHHKMQNFSLGPRILRTETAALTAISLMQQQWGDLGHR